jgi:hypothetical protein
MIGARDDRRSGRARHDWGARQSTQQARTARLARATTVAAGAHGTIGTRENCRSGRASRGQNRPAVVGPYNGNHDRNHNDDPPERKCGRDERNARFARLNFAGGSRERTRRGGQNHNEHDAAAEATMNTMKPTEAR